MAIHRNSGEYDADGNLRRQWVGTKRDSGETFALPPGHVVKGESTLLDADNRVVARWIKTREGDGAGLVEALQEAFAAYRGAAQLVPLPASSDDDLLTVYPLPDLHVGMLSWGAETGADYDLDIAVQTITAALTHLVAQSRPSRHAVILGLGDLIHTNDQTNSTPASKHRLDVDGRWPKIYAAAAKLLTVIVDLVAQKHERVEIVVVPGNHDQDAAVCMTVALSLFYQNNERLTVYDAPGLTWYRRFGRCLLGAIHGHTVRKKDMALMMAADRPKDWGETDHRSFYSGHVHHETALEVGPVRVESFNSPASRDAYAQGAGYRSGRALSAITWHAQAGEIGRHRVNIGATP